MSTTKLRNSDIFTNSPRPAPVVAALQDLIKRPVAARTGLKIRRIVRTVNQQIEDIFAERDRIVELHGTPDGEMVQLDETGQAAFVELLGLEFEV